MIRKIDSNIFSLTILKVTTFSRIRQFHQRLSLLSQMQDYENIGCFLQKDFENMGHFTQKDFEETFFLRIFAPKLRH